ncbi:MAG TPA: universal stress protein [Anaerolineae bacterium]|nr:universal stress protein [Anaerolineae bacterium]HQH37015.1 universal stress protein [Anaerolineae bacterium]
MEAHRGPFSHILVPTDGSETSIHAGEVAIHIATLCPTQVTFVYVIDDKTAEEVSRTTRKTAEEVRREFGDQAQRYLGYLARLAAQQDVAADQVIRYGTPHIEITELAREIHADLIVIGRVGGVGTQRLARIGSVAERVIEYAHCPVLTVRYSPHG